jgi:hypothetical protein
MARRLPFAAFALAIRADRESFSAQRISGRISERGGETYKNVPDAQEERAPTCETSAVVLQHIRGNRLALYRLVSLLHALLPAPDIHGLPQTPRRHANSLDSLNHRLKRQLEEILQESSLPGVTLGFTLPDRTIGSLAVASSGPRRKKLRVS